MMTPCKELFVYTRHRDGGLSINVPCEEAITSMLEGAHQGISRAEFESDVLRQVDDGIAEDVARRFLGALCFGGVGRRESLRLIRDRCIPRRGYNIVEIARRDVPNDRSFRDAWRFAHNERRFYVDVEAARPIQYRRYVVAVRDENRRRSEDMYGARPVRFNRDWLRYNIETARDEIELARIVPDLSV